MKKLIILSDWVDDSLSRQEFKTAVEGYLTNPDNYLNLNFVSVTPSTIHTSFLLNQIVETEEIYGRPLNTVIFQNTDPRLESNKGVVANQGSQFLIIKLQSGIFICGPNAGYNFSLIKDKVLTIFYYPGYDHGSQFRSRDLYGRVCAHLVDELEDSLDLEETKETVIPPLTGYYIGHIDNFGNIKTTMTVEDLKGKVEFGEEVKIAINKIVNSAVYVKGLFGGSVGQLVIYPGSSGKKDNPYLEIGIWQHFNTDKLTSGLTAFKFPRPGMKIDLL